MKTYSNKSNAKRAAKKLGENSVVFKISEGKWAAFEDWIDEKNFINYGLINCPHCGINLDNGVTLFDPGFMQHEFLCLGCDTEFGEVVEVKAKVEAPKTEGLKIEKDRPEQNGIKKPSIGGKCRAIWDECDKLLVANGKTPMPKELKTIAAEKGWNINNTIIELYQWRKFHGIVKAVKK